MTNIYQNHQQRLIEKSIKILQCLVRNECSPDRAEQLKYDLQVQYRKLQSLLKGNLCTH